MKSQIDDGFYKTPRELTKKLESTEEMFNKVLTEEMVAGKEQYQKIIRELDKLENGLLEEESLYVDDLFEKSNYVTKALKTGHEFKNYLK